ncbi:MAG: hypothetical protein MZW92_44600 [Comamonadaceae bacterium]|nr:hypothetical protein [Comamonadaceae bacterium]
MPDSHAASPPQVRAARAHEPARASAAERLTVSEHRDPRARRRRQPAASRASCRTWSNCASAWCARRWRSSSCSSR